MTWTALYSLTNARLSDPDRETLQQLYRAGGNLEEALAALTALDADRQERYNILSYDALYRETAR